MALDDDIILDGLTFEEIEKIYADILEGDGEYIAAYCCSSQFGTCTQYSGSKCPSGWYSDLRLKNILGNNSAGLKEIIRIVVKDYIYKNDENNIVHTGVIAQDLKRIFPNAVKEDKDGYLMIRTEDMFYAMINSIKELYYENNILSEKLNETEARVKKLECGGRSAI